METFCIGLETRLITEFSIILSLKEGPHSSDYQNEQAFWQGNHALETVNLHVVVESEGVATVVIGWGAVTVLGEVDMVGVVTLVITVVEGCMWQTDTMLYCNT